MPIQTKQSELLPLSLYEVSELVHSKKLSPVELTQACLARIEALNPELNAFITVTAEMALGQARAAEAEIQNRCTAFVTNAANMIFISGTVSYPAQPLPH